jgi:hypothetical protein
MKVTVQNSNNKKRKNNNTNPQSSPRFDGEARKIIENISGQTALQRKLANQSIMVK